jgi:hypothetical protein
MNYIFNGRLVTLCFNYDIKVLVDIKTKSKVKKSVTETHSNVLGSNEQSAVSFYTNHVRTSSRILISILESKKVNIAWAFYNDVPEHPFLNREEEDELFKQIIK